MKTVSKLISGDKAIWLVILLLATASLLLVYSSIVTLAYKHHGGNTIYYLFRHGMFLLFGLGIIFFIHKVKYTYFSRVAQLALYISIPLLLLTLIVGENINDASRWLRIPVINQTFQTSDLAKLALVMYVARALSQYQEELRSFKEVLLKLGLPIFLVCGLILPANFSTAAVLFGCCLILLFIGRVPFKNIFGLLGIAVAGGLIVLGTAIILPDLLPRADTWKKRIQTFGTEQVDAQANYQVEQSKIAIATGGISGKGPGNSTQRNFLPHPYSDFIYAIVLEEYGLIGGLVILFLYMILMFRSVRLVVKTPKNFGAFLVVGISFMLVFQALINMAVAVNLLPVTGQPLPLVSMGGTSIWFTCIALGIILSVSSGVDSNNEIMTSRNYATA